MLDSCISEPALVAIVGGHKRYQVCGGAHGYFDAPQVTRNVPRSDEGIQ